MELRQRKENLIKHLFSQAGTRIFAVNFTKKTNGELRTMRARLHVKPKYKLEPETNPDTDRRTTKFRKKQDEKSGTMTVYEMKGRKSDFRKITLANVNWVQIDGVRFYFGTDYLPKTEKKDFSEAYW